MSELSIYGVMIIPLIVGIVELIKRVGHIPTNFIPLVAVAIGLSIGVFLHYPDYPQGIIIGIALGLSAIGLYSGTKNTIEH